MGKGKKGKHTHKQTHTDRQTHTHTYTHAYTHTHTRTHSDTHTYIHTYIHIYIHTHITKSRNIHNRIIPDSLIFCDVPFCGRNHMGVPQSTKWNPVLRGPMISGPIQLAFDTFETPVVMFSSGSGYHVNTQTISISCSLVVVPSV